MKTAINKSKIKPDIQYTRLSETCRSDKKIKCHKASSFRTLLLAHSLAKQPLGFLFVCLFSLEVLKLEMKSERRHMPQPCLHFTFLCWSSKVTQQEVAESPWKQNTINAKKSPQHQVYDGTSKSVLQQQLHLGGYFLNNKFVSMKDTFCWYC